MIWQYFVIDMFINRGNISILFQLMLNNKKQLTLTGRLSYRNQLTLTGRFEQCYRSNLVNKYLILKINVLHLVKK